MHELKCDLSKYTQIVQQTHQAFMLLDFLQVYEIHSLSFRQQNVLIIECLQVFIMQFFGLIYRCNNLQGTRLVSM